MTTESWTFKYYSTGDCSSGQDLVILSLAVQQLQWGEVPCMASGCYFLSAKWGCTEGGGALQWVTGSPVGYLSGIHLNSVF